MFNRKRKGFTIVELVIVIAVIGILTAVLIPIFSNMVGRANVAADTALVTNINKQLTIAEQTDGKNQTMYDALMDARDAGYIVSSINARSDNQLIWDSTIDRFALVDKEGKTVAGTINATNNLDLWKISNTVDANYSTYYTGTAQTITTSKGFDCGDNNNITAINYTNSGSAQSVTIRTNSVYTSLNINAANDTVKHYGVANAINVTAVGMHSYHENGSVAALNIKSGKVKVEQNAFVGKVAVDKDASSSTVNFQNNGIVFATEVITYNETALNHSIVENPTNEQKAIINNVETTSSDDIIKIGNPYALINLASAQSQGIISGSLRIELLADIDLTGKTWVPFGADLTQNDHYAFEGTIDGKNHTITGLSNGSYRGVQIANNTTGQIGEHYGFIANAGENVTISNLKFTAVNIESSTATVCGAVIAYAEGSNITLNNVKVKGNISAADKVSGLIGYAKVNAMVIIENCSVDANLTANEFRVGGFFGFASAANITINNSSFAGKIVAKGYLSGKNYIAAIGSIHSAGKNQLMSLSVTNFTVDGDAQIQTPTGLASERKISSSNGKVLVSIMTGNISSTGIENNVASEQEFTISLNN